MGWFIAGIVFVVVDVIAAIVTGAAYSGKAAMGIGIAIAVLFIFCLILAVWLMFLSVIPAC